MASTAAAHEVVVEVRRIILELARDGSHQVLGLLLLGVALALGRRYEHRKAVRGRPPKVEFHVVVGLEDFRGARLADGLEIVGILRLEVGGEEEVLLDVGLDIGEDAVAPQVGFHHRVGSALPEPGLILRDLTGYVGVGDLDALAIAVLAEQYHIDRVQ